MGNYRKQKNLHRAKKWPRLESPQPIQHRPGSPFSDEGRLAGFWNGSYFANVGNFWQCAGLYDGASSPAGWRFQINTGPARLTSQLLDRCFRNQQNRNPVANGVHALAFVALQAVLPTKHQGFAANGTCEDLEQIRTDHGRYCKPRFVALDDPSGQTASFAELR